MRNIMGGIFRYAAIIVGWLIEPPAGLEKNLRRRLKLLSAFLLLFAINTVWGSIYLKNASDTLWVPLAITSSVCIIGYGFSRTKYYLVAIVIAVSITAFPSVYAFLFSTDQAYTAATLMWLTLPLLISGLLLSIRLTIIIGITYLVLLIAIAPFSIIDSASLSQMFAFLSMIFFLVIVTAAIRRHDQSEIELQLGERLRTEKILRESEEKFRSLFEYAKDTIILADTQTGILLDINPAGCRLVGLPKEKIVGRHQSELHPRGLAEKYQQIFREHVKQGIVVSDDIIIQHADGSHIHCDLSASVIKMGDREVIQGVFRDITERKRMQKALENEVTWRRILIEQSRDGIVILDQNSGVYEANRRFAEMLGYSQKETSKLHVWDWDTQYTKEQLKEMISTVTEAGDHIETYHRRKDGTTFEVEISTNGATIEGQKFVFCVCRDVTERKRMEKALKESEEKFSKAFRASPEAISISSLKDNAFIDVNDSYIESTGYTREELLGKSASDFNMFVDAKQRDKIVGNIRKRVRMHNEESQFRTKSGEIRTKLISTEFINVGDEPCALVVGTDITERKRAEEAFRERERRFSDIADNALEWIWEVDSKGKYTYSSPVVEKILGYKPEEVLKKHFYDFFLPEEREKLKKAAFGAFAQKQPFKEFTNMNRCKNGKTVELMTSGVPVLDEKGNLLGYRGVDTDITERKKTEETLKTSEERFRLIADNSTDLISRIQLGPPIKTDYVSPSCLRITGYKQEEFYTDSNLGLEMIHPEDREFFVKIVDPDKKGRQKPITARLVRKDGRIVWIEQTHTIIYNESGEPVAMHLIARDMTERIQMEEALRESEEKFSKAFHSGPESIAITTLKDGKYVDVNDNYIRSTGYSYEELIGSYTRDINIWAKPKDRARLFKILKEQGRVSNEEFDFRMKSGEIRTWLFSAENIDIAGEACLIGVSVDITERKQMEEALRESEEKFSKAFHSGPESIAITTLKDGKFIEVNDSFTLITGYTREEVIGHSSSEINIWASVKDRDKMLQLLKKNGKVDAEEFEFCMKSGEIRTWLFSAEKINIEGKPCIISITTDITERIRAEKLQQDENSVLTLLGQGAELSEMLDAIIHLGESHDPSVKGSVLLYDSEKGLLMQAAGPSLPTDYQKMLESGVPIGPEMGSCGTAAYTKKRVIVEDIANSPLFTQEEVVKGANRNGLYACWSQPIIASDGEVLGTIANYSNKTGEPDDGDLRVLEWSARIAAIAIERKRAEKALRESEEKFSIAFRSSPQQIIITRTKDGIIIDINDSFTRVTGFTREETVGHSAEKLNIWVNPGDYERMMRILNEQGRLYNEEFDFCKKSGEIHTELLSVEKVNIGGDECLLSLLTDITERKEMEETLRFSDAAFKSIHESVIVTNLEGEITLWNEISEQLFGLKVYEVMGKKFLEVIEVVETYPGEKQDRIKKIQEQGHWQEERIYHTRKGDIWVDVHLQDIVDNGKRYGRVMLASDITQRKQAEAELKRALAELEESSAKLSATNKELEAFSYSVSHDLRSPLRSIDGFSQALLEDYEGKLDETGQDYLKRLRGASQKMGELIDGLLKLSRLTRSEMHRETVDLSALAEEIAERLRETHPKRRARFIIEKGLNAEGDPQLLRALLENLLSNAWKFTRNKPEAKIEFRLDHNGSSKAYFIKDNGAGFDMTYSDKLFGAFQRLHDTNDFPGTGIGLATVQRIIHRHGGTVRAEGAVGKGATFYFTLN